MQTTPLPDDVVRNYQPPTLSQEAMDRIEATIKQRRAEKANLSPTERKLHPWLRPAPNATRAPSAKQAADAEPNPMLQYDDAGRVRVVVSIASASALSDAAAAGFEAKHTQMEKGYAVGAIALTRTADLAAVEGVTSIRPLVKSGVLRAGSVQTEGDAALRADILRATLGVDGRSIRVGVISDGTGGLADAQASGDLPPVVEECPISDNAGGDIVSNNGAEGTALLEIIHDVAPGASLLFCPGGGGGEPGLAQSILSLANDLHADIIVDDIGILTEPYFEDGVVAQAVDEVFANGVVYFSSAGNGAQDHYEAAYVDVSDTSIGFPNAHDFGLAAGVSSTIIQPGLVGGTPFAPGNFFAAFLQWNDPFGSSGDDYDLYLFDRLGFPAGDPAGIFPTGGVGIALQDGDDDPLEFAFVVNETPNIEDVLLVVDRASSADPDKLLEINYNGTLAIAPTFNVPEGSVWGHTAAQGALAVGAIDVSDPGLDEIEPFSSRGPSLIFFPSFEARNKPDFTAVDGVSVTGAGGFPSTFFGTSASAPHAAAIGALLLELNPLLTPQQVGDLLKQTALDRGDPGFDFIFGAGLIDALDAGEHVPPVDEHEALAALTEQVYALGTSLGPVRTFTLAFKLELARRFLDPHELGGRRVPLAIRTLDTFTRLVDRFVRLNLIPDKAAADLHVLTAALVNALEDEVHRPALASADAEAALTLADKAKALGEAALPTEFALGANYPNPFRDMTRIEIDVPEASTVRLEVFDVMGRKIATLADQTMTPGRHTLQWAPDAGIASGMYFARMKANDTVHTRRIVIVR